MRYSTIGQKLLWSYANLCMAHAALDGGATEYSPRWYRIRSHMWARFNNGEFAPRSLMDDEKLKLKEAPSCAYCASEQNLTADHLIPTSKGGTNAGENLIRACRPCNSSKNNRDLMEWYNAREKFPPLLVLRRYLKHCIQITNDARLMNHSLADLVHINLPFSIDSIPTEYPEPQDLCFNIGDCHASSQLRIS